MSFCGSACGACPSGFSCQNVVSVSGATSATCYPNNASCANSPTGVDMAAPAGSADGGGHDGGGPDMAMPCTIPTGGSVTASGGTVDRLYFGITGDTRPMSNSTHYPSSLQMVINNIFDQMGQKGVQFAVDQGDHLEAGNSSAASGQMGDYATATSKLGKPVFMTMGNHECSSSLSGAGCGGSCTADFKCNAFLNALGPISTDPYYRVDVMTAKGLAIFIVVADDAWNSTQQSWLAQQLTYADTHAKYTFVSKHHPDGNTDRPEFQQIYDLVKSHKYTLFLTGHSHEYKRQISDPRAIVMGLGGAPFDNPNQMWWGYGTVMQCPDDHIYVTIYDQATGTTKDSFSVPPQ
jgi:hypothetical protein